MSRFALATVFLLCFQNNAYSGSNDHKPKMKVVDRSWGFFKAIPCEKLEAIKTYSEGEAKLLKKRRENCLKAVSVFLPKPINN